MVTRRVREAEWRWLAVSVLAAACGEASSEPLYGPIPEHALLPVEVDLDVAVTSVDEMPVDVEPNADESCTVLPPRDALWIRQLEESVVQRLSGALPLTASVTLTGRSLPNQRLAARNYLARQLGALGIDHESYSLEPEAAGAHLIARLPAAAPGESAPIIVGGHLDSAGFNIPGAADNATGTALVLAVARYLSGITCREREVWFVWFDLEEWPADGVEINFVQSDFAPYGGAILAERIMSSPERPASVHNFDMLSWDGDGDGAYELWGRPDALDALYLDVARELGITLVPEPNPGEALTDHLAFERAGIAAIGLGETFFSSGDATPNYHRFTDTADQVDFAYLGRATELAIAAVLREVVPAPR